MSVRELIGKNPSIFIEKQFPSIYREEAQELVSLVEEYYRFLERDIQGYYVAGYSNITQKNFSEKFSTKTEADNRLKELQDSGNYLDLEVVEMKNQSVYHARRMFEYRDIDTTAINMLLFYRNKYLRNLPFDQTNIRFILKNIMELYRRKGSKEGIELFFKMFYNEEVEIYYPSYDMLKPSSSRWIVGKYIQLYPIEDVTSFSDIIGKRVFGSVSKSEAFVDNVYFARANKSLIPIVFLSDIRGEFRGSDTIFRIEPTRKIYGRVYGSIDEVTSLGFFQGTPDNKVGDIVDLKSPSGYGGKARVTSVTEDLSGEISFEVVNGSYGYTVDGTDIILSNQTIFLDNSNLEFVEYEKVVQTNAFGTFTGRVIGQNTESVGILLDDENEPFTQGTFSTLDREENKTFQSLFVLEVNSTASAEVGEVQKTEEIEIIVDLIEDFLNVPINSVNYSTVPPAQASLSGGAANLSTPLNDAFVPQTFNVGNITKLTNINPGSDYENNVFVLARENLLSKFNFRNQIISYSIDNSDVNLLVDDVIVQEKQVLNFEGQTITRQARGVVVEKIGNDIYVKQLSFEPFVKENDFFKENSDIPITINSISRDTSSLPLGLNAEINGISEFLPGKILDVSIFDSGVGYEHNSTIEMFNTRKIEEAKEALETAIANGESQSVIDDLQDEYDLLRITPAASGIGKSRSQGITEGKWETTTSHLNSQDGKVIQDSEFYQDFSYEIYTSLNPELYEENLRDVAHPAGTSLFTSFSNFGVINNNIEILQETNILKKVDYVIEQESNDNIVIGEDGTQYLVTNFE